MYSAKPNRNRHYLVNTLKMSALSLLLFSAACTADSEATDPGKESKPSGETTQTAASVYDLALKQAQELESYTVDSKTNYKVEQTAAEGAKAPDPIETAIEIAGDVIAKPETQYGLKINTLSQGQQGTTEIYAAGSELHAKDSAGTWSTQKLEGSEEELSVTTEMLDPAPLIEELGEYKDSLKLTEDDASYTLALEASGEQAGALMQTALGRQLGDSEQSAPTADLFKSGAEGTVSYSLVVDKKSNQLTSSSVKVDTTLLVNKQDLHIVANSDGAYSAQNEVGEIAVPAEATADAAASGTDAATDSAAEETETSGK
ncbi:DUF6612 family protein [Saccharibacillus brassicae]|uniref:Lipoprotein n=1 Tax=Saccharibacillus brassicae TaxID=2583377 RepID=A0A4Y6UV40_SACBS|nr:DUF6612 family protein [Saccharibacillus brassicae]QDH21583.1 hypothetical protein FFV09_12470 [Saccharibacillus brassicae]